MAITQNPFIGRSSGKMANGVFSTWKDKNVLRSKALEVHNPRTTGQVLTRGKLAVVVKAGRGVLDIIRLTFKEYTTSQSAWNEYVKLGVKDIPVVGGVPSLLTFLGQIWSKGSLAPVVGSTLGAVTSSTVAATWTNNANGTTGLSTDTIRLIAVNGDTGESTVASTIKTRADAAGTFSFPLTGMDTGDYNYFMVVYNPALGKAGDSMLCQ